MKKNWEFEETRKKVKVTYEDENGLKDVDVIALKKQHLKGLFENHCILNQDFLKYITSFNLTGKPLNLFLFLLGDMDRKNKVYTDYIELSKILKQNPGAISNNLKVLADKKIILRKKIRTGLYEISINEDMINPLLAFKNKGTRENVLEHKKLINQEGPYLKQPNIYGEIDYVNPLTGEVFHTDNKIITNKEL